MTSPSSLVESTVPPSSLSWAPLPAAQSILGTGADRLSFLHRLLTANIAGAKPGDSVRALLLDPKATIIADFLVLVGDDDVRLLCPGGDADAACASLSKYAVMDDFSCAVEPDWAWGAILAPETGAADASAVTSLVTSQLASFSAAMNPAPVVYVMKLWGRTAWLLGAPATVLSQCRSQLASVGTQILSPEECERLRIDAGEPAWGREVTSAFFPMEIGLGGAIAYNKGCFLGQEPIIRVRDRGHLNWRLVRLRSDSTADVSAAGTISIPAREKAGQVTSAILVAQDPEPYRALAVVHSSVADGAVVNVSHAGTTIAARVFPA